MLPPCPLRQSPSLLGSSHSLGFYHLTFFLDHSLSVFFLLPLKLATTYKILSEIHLATSYECLPWAKYCVHTLRKELAHFTMLIFLCACARSGRVGGQSPSMINKMLPAGRALAVTNGPTIWLKQIPDWEASIQEQKHLQIPKHCHPYLSLWWHFPLVKNQLPDNFQIISSVIHFQSSITHCECFPW